MEYYEERVKRFLSGEEDPVIETIMKYYTVMTNREIARLVNRSVNTVVRIISALKKHGLLPDVKKPGRPRKYKIDCDKIIKTYLRHKNIKEASMELGITPQALTYILRIRCGTNIYELRRKDKIERLLSELSKRGFVKVKYREIRYLIRHLPDSIGVLSIRAGKGRGVYLYDKNNPAPLVEYLRQILGERRAMAIAREKNLLSR